MTTDVSSDIATISAYMRGENTPAVRPRLAMRTPTSPRGIMPTPTMSALRLPSASAPRKPPASFDSERDQP